MNGKLLAALIVVIALGAIGWYLQREPAPPALMQPGEETTAPAQPPLTRDGATPPAATEPVEVPPPAQLEDSDAKVAESLDALSPKLADWLTPADQLRKWIAVVDAAAGQDVPDKNRPLNYPLDRYQVSEQGGELRPAPANAERFKPLVDAITAIPPERLAAYYHAWQPLLDQAYAELGRSGRFDQRLRLAIERVLAVEPLTEPPALERPKFNYVYADPELERASELNKVLWRLGEDNLVKLQNYLRQLQPLL